MASQRAFPLNAWYAIAWDASLHQLLPRTVANKKIVLYRRSDGRPVALRRCLLAPAVAALQGTS